MKYSMRLVQIAAVAFLMALSTFAANVGDQCDAVADCSDTPTNWQCAKLPICNKGTCLCKSGFTGTDCADTIAVPTAKTNGLECGATTDYCSDATVCNSDTPPTCECVAPAVFKNDISRCVPAAYKKIGEACTAATDCRGVGAGVKGNYLCTSGVCTCSLGTKAAADNIECVFYSRDETCAVDTAICMPGYSCHVRSNKCVCQGDNVWNDDVEMCVHKDATDNVATDKVCTDTYALATSKICADDLVCLSCPESATEFKCFKYDVSVGRGGANATGLGDDTAGSGESPDAGGAASILAAVSTILAALATALVM